MNMIQTNDGVNINYTDKGAGNPIVLISGYSGPLCTWEYEEKALLEKGYRVICMDRRNHGDSDCPTYGQRMSRHGKDIHDLLESLDLHNAVLVGHSMGASSIWAYVSLFGEERLRAIINIDQTPKMLSDDKWKNGMYHLDFAAFPTFFDDPIPDGTAGPVNEELMGKMLQKMEEKPFDLKTTFPLLLDHAFADWRDVIERTKINVLFIAGRKSPYWPCAHAADSAQLCKNGTYEIIEDCGHIVPLEQPEKLKETIERFLITLENE